MEKRKSCIIHGPIHSFSNFGERSRDIAYALISKSNYFDTHILSYNEQYSRNGYDINDLQSYEIKSLHDVPDIDIWIEIGFPHSFERKGKINIGVTDSFIYKPLDGFINKCNSMDLIWTYSKYSLETIKNFKVNDLSITTPIYILPEFSHLNDIQTDNINDILKDVKENWNFLCVGQWEVTDSNEFGGWNKDNIRFIIKNFLKTFAGISNPPGLILKIHGDKASVIDRTNILKVINKIIDNTSHNEPHPNIYLINDDLTYEEAYSLYNNDKIKALIHIPQRSDSVQSELDFMISGKPIIFSEWAAQNEILNYEGNISTKGKTKRIGLDCSPILIDTPQSDIILAMYEIYYHYDRYLNMSKENSKYILNNHNKEQLISIIDILLRQEQSS